MFCGKCRKHYDTGGVVAGRQYRCAKCHAQRLVAMLTGEAKVKGTRWSEEDLETLKDLWARSPIDEVYAAFPKRSQDSIRRTAERHSLYRPQELVLESLKQRGRKGAEVLAKVREAKERREEAMLALQQVVTRDFAPIRFSPDGISQIVSQWVRA